MYGIDHLLLWHLHQGEIITSTSAKVNGMVSLRENDSKQLSAFVVSSHFIHVHRNKHREVTVR